MPPLEFDENDEIGSEVEEGVEGVCWDVEDELPTDDEEDEPSMPPSSTSDEEACYSPLVGRYHERTMILPDQFLDGPSVGAVPTSDTPRCLCSELPPPESFRLPFDLPLRFFKLFFTPLVFNTLAANTNLYAEENHAGQSGRAWWPCSIAEIKIWIGTKIYLSVFGTGRSDELWSTNNDYPQHCISKAMSQFRWEQIKRYFHCSPPNGTLLASQFFNKLEPVATMLQESFPKVVVPATNVAVDECMVRFTGRSKNTVMIRDKPVPVGYYILALFEAGYMFAFSFKGASGYAGRDLQTVLNGRLPQLPVFTTSQSAMMNQLVRNFKSGAEPCAPASSQ